MFFLWQGQVRKSRTVWIIEKVHVHWAMSNTCPNPSQAKYNKYNMDRGHFNGAHTAFIVCCVTGWIQSSSQRKPHTLKGWQDKSVSLFPVVTSQSHKCSLHLSLPPDPCMMCEKVHEPTLIPTHILMCECVRVFECTWVGAHVRASVCVSMHVYVRLFLL